jgi:hypothetical protein
MKSQTNRRSPLRSYTKDFNSRFDLAYLLEEKFITVNEAAKLLGLAASTVHNGGGSTAHLSRIRTDAKRPCVPLLLSEVLAYKARLIEAAK